MAFCCRLPSVCLPARTHFLFPVCACVCDGGSNRRGLSTVKVRRRVQAFGALVADSDAERKNERVQGKVRTSTMAIETKRCVWVTSLFSAVELQFFRITRHNPHRMLLLQHMSPDDSHTLNQFKENDLIKNRTGEMTCSKHLPASAGGCGCTVGGATHTHTCHTRVNLVRCSAWCWS